MTDGSWRNRRIWFRPAPTEWPKAEDRKPPPPPPPPPPAVVEHVIANATRAFGEQVLDLPGLPGESVDAYRTRLMEHLEQYGAGPAEQPRRPIVTEYDCLNPEGE